MNTKRILSRTGTKKKDQSLSRISLESQDILVCSQEQFHHPTIQTLPFSYLYKTDEVILYQTLLFPCLLVLLHEVRIEITLVVFLMAHERDAYSTYVRSSYNSIYGVHICSLPNLSFSVFVQATVTLSYAWGITSKNNKLSIYRIVSLFVLLLISVAIVDLCTISIIIYNCRHSLLILLS